MSRTASFLTILFTVSAMVVMMAVGALSVYIQKKSLTDLVKHNFVTLAQAYSSTINNYLTEKQEKILFFKSDMRRGDMKWANFQSMGVLGVLDNDKDFEAVYVVDNSGAVAASNNSSFIGKKDARYGNIQDQHIATASGVDVSEVYYSNILNMYVVDFHTAISSDDQDKKPVGTLVAIISVKKLAQIIKAREKLDNFIDVYLTNNQGLLLTPSKYLPGENHGVLTQKVANQNVKDCVEMRDKSQDHKYLPKLYSDFRGEVVLGTHEHINSSWCLIVEGSEEALITRTIKDSLRIYFLLSAIIIALAATLGFLSAKELKKYG